MSNGQDKELSENEKKFLEKFRSKDVTRVVFCSNGTRQKCIEVTQSDRCSMVHFKKLIFAHTDESLGNCSYLDTCRHMDYCKFVHYRIDERDLKQQNIHGADPDSEDQKNSILNRVKSCEEDSRHENSTTQWINTDLRILDFEVLGKFNVIMLDPPWDIHMNLPYGTLKDKEMKALNISSLQDAGLVFLWVTGRAMELGRECLEIWGYKKIEEIVWVKTNQLQRIIRTGRTGHWLNHSKEHCLVGLKGWDPKINKNLDCDVIVSEVRETSRKPDEIYGIIERMRPGGRKLELFARPHNRRPGWLSVGNQLPGIYLTDKNVIGRFQEKYKNYGLTQEMMDESKRQDEAEQTKALIYHNHILKNRITL